MDDIATAAVHAGATPRPVNAPGAPPLYASSGWTFDGIDQIDGIYDGAVPGVPYGTLGGPNHTALDRLIAALEGAEAATCANGGMTAIANALWHLLRPGDRVVAARDLFGPTAELLERDLARWDVACERVDATDLDAVARALQQRPTAVLYAETISNPRLRVVDIAALSARAHAHGARLVIDNTFASPALCRPLAHGADLVVESLTKYVGGHDDCVAGAVAGPRAAIEAMRPAMLRAGQLPSPFEAWLCARGARTLALRIDAACRNAERLAGWLEDHPAAESVLYPGLPSHPDHAVAQRVLGGKGGGVLSFELAGGRPAVDRFVDGLNLIELLSSLGGVATTINHPATTSHRGMGIGDGLVRVAVGIEAPDDLIADLEPALAASGSAGSPGRRTAPAP